MALKRGKTAKETNQMTTKTLNQTKNVKLADGRKIERKATVTVAEIDPKSENAIAEIRELLKENVELYAYYGYRTYCRVSASNAMLGGSNLRESNKELSKALRSFKASLKTMTEIMELKPEEAIALLRGKSAFKAVFEYLDSIASGGETLTLDYVQNVPLPKSFEDDEAESAEAEEEDGE